MGRRARGLGALAGLLLLGACVPNQSLDPGLILYRQGKYQEAIPLYELAIAFYSTTMGSNHPVLVRRYTGLAALYRELGRFDEAEATTLKALRVAEASNGLDHADYEHVLWFLTRLYEMQARYADEEAMLKRELAKQEAALGAEHPVAAKRLINLGDLYQTLRRYDEADAAYARALAIRAKALGAEDGETLTATLRVAGLRTTQHRPQEAEALIVQVVAIQERTLGPDHPDTVFNTANIGHAYTAQARYAEAEAVFTRVLTTRERVFGPKDHRRAWGFADLSRLYEAQGRYRDSEAMAKRALDILDQTVESSDPKIAWAAYGLGADQGALERYQDLAGTMITLGRAYEMQGRYAEAETVYQRALAILDKTSGPDHPNLADALLNLGNVYYSQGRIAESEAPYQHVTVIYRKAYGDAHPALATALDNLANSYDQMRRFADGETLHRRALTIRETALGPDHPDVALSLENLALCYQLQQRWGDAEPLATRAVSVRERVLGPDHPLTAAALAALADITAGLGRNTEARALAERALAIRERSLGADHPDVARNLEQLARLEREAGAVEVALAHMRRATEIGRQRARTAGATRDAGIESEQRGTRRRYVDHVDLLAAAMAQQPARRAALITESFEVGQLASYSSAGAALAQLSARFAVGSGNLATLVRTRQDGIDRWRRIEIDLIAASSRPADQRDRVTEARLRTERTEIDGRLAGIDRQLTAEFPQFVELSNPAPPSLSAVQALLGADEALLAYVVDGGATYLWVVRRDRAELLRLAVGADALATAVRGLRRQLDPDTNPDLAAYDVRAAHALYQALIAPAMPQLDGAGHLFVVLDGALTSLPLGTLVMEAVPDVVDPADYRRVPWLARRYAISVLPTVSSLRALRVLAQSGRAPAPFVGVGDPVLQGPPGTARGVKLATLFRGGGADVDSVRRLPPLPDTADELKALARAQGASDNELFLGARATETSLKAAPLDQYRTIAFATHGLVAGELSGLSEPALVLTPPAQPSADDDGLLTASEITQLKLNADWVIMSACNTAAGDQPGGEGLSGLAKAFFYAGSRALVVSHWPVASQAAVRLTTGTFEAIRLDPRLGRAEALRQSQMALLDDASMPIEFAHPLVWAPFVIVGEGGGGR